MKRWCFILFISVTYLLPAQDKEQNIDLNRLADEIFSLQDQDLNYEDLYENLVLRWSHPLDLNTASVEDFRSLFILKETHIQDILKHRATSPFLSIYELQSLPSFDLPTVQLLSRFVRISDPSFNGNLLHRLLREENNYLLVRYERTLEDKLGYRESDTTRKYVGSPDKIYTRFRVSRPNDFSLGITAEKDAGEQVLFNKQQSGMDFLSAHFQVQNKGLVKNLVVGDFMAQFGQGLVAGGGLGMGKGAETITTIRRSNIGFSPYSSIVESGFFRGGAVTLEPVRKIYTSAFVSLLKRDGIMQQDSSEFISSLLLSGLHRTPGELAARKQLTETNLGAVLEYRGDALQVGSILHITRFDVPVYRHPNLYNQFIFSGNRNLNISAFASYSWSNFLFFGEVARSHGNGNALVTGVLGSVSQKFDVSMLVRSYDRNYHGLYANAISENTSTQNEKGIYWGWKYTHTKRTILSAYADLFQFPWLRFRGYAPSDGYEWLIRFSHQPSKTVSAFVQVREESKIRNLGDESFYYQTKNGVKRNWSLNVDYQSNGFSLKTRLQYSSYHLTTSSTGFAIIEEIGFDWQKISIAARYALFDTDDFENRQYTYERDVWLAYSLPSYFGAGTRALVLIQYDLSKKISCSLRWTKTSYLNQEYVGSGGEQIAGNTKTDVKFLTRIRF